MDTIAINISWEFFLSIIGSLVALAYYANGRFTGLETDVPPFVETIPLDFVARASTAAPRDDLARF